MIPYLRPDVYPAPGVKLEVYRNISVSCGDAGMQILDKTKLLITGITLKLLNLNAIVL